MTGIAAGRRRPVLSTVLLAGWLALVVSLVVDHAFWRDEVVALSYALRGETLLDMWLSIRGEGHPALWYALLRTGHALFGNPVLPILSVATALPRSSKALPIALGQARAVPA